MSNDVEKFIKNIQNQLSYAFEDGDPNKPLTKLGRIAIHSVKSLQDNFSEYNRFTEEMIQNAEDSNSSEIVFTINEKEVTSITEVGSSTKQDTDTIGMFGLGFKSVFLLSDTPIIRSGNFNFSFNSNTCIYPHLELPQPKEFDPGKTYVILPLKSNLVSGILHSIRNHYYKISELFLFLKSLKKIKIEDDKEGEIIFEKKINENITTIYET